MNCVWVHPLEAFVTAPSRMEEDEPLFYEKAKHCKFLAPSLASASLSLPSGFFNEYFPGARKVLYRGQSYFLATSRSGVLCAFPTLTPEPDQLAALVILNLKPLGTPTAFLRADTGESSLFSYLEQHARFSQANPFHEGAHEQTR